jgi:citrate lyase subunit beta / citryl-CoA lyase
MTQTRPRRSALFMPASNVRAIDKARTLHCDVVILDLEDAVAPEAKDIARRQAVEAVRSGGFGRREVVIRVNGLDTPWGRDDLAAADEAGVHVILVPKVSTADDVTAYDAALSGPSRLWVMIETCRALFHLDAIASRTSDTRLSAWVIGTNDLAKEMRCRLDLMRTALVAPLCLAVAAARAHGLPILDGVYNELEDDAGLKAQCVQGADLGFDGKTLIHPRQIDTANNAFSPDAGEVASARVVIAAFDADEAVGKGVLRVDGRMVERMHLTRAREVVAFADAIAETGAGG